MNLDTGEIRPVDDVAPEERASGRWIELDADDVRVLQKLTPAERIAFKVRGKTNVPAARRMLADAYERDARASAAEFASAGL